MAYAINKNALTKVIKKYKIYIKKKHIKNNNKNIKTIKK